MLVHSFYKLLTNIGFKPIWKEFKAEYERTFGTLEERKYPLKVLLEYAQTMLGKSLNDLLMDSKISWARRNQQEQEENN